MQITSLSPVIQVSDLEISIRFYCDLLRFSKEFAYGEPPFYVGVKYDDVVLHLCSGSETKARRGQGSLYFFCDEVDAYYETLTAKGVTVTSPLASYPYGMRDFQIKDPDGNLLCFGAPTDGGKA